MRMIQSCHNQNFFRINNEVSGLWRKYNAAFMFMLISKICLITTNPGKPRSYHAYTRTGAHTHTHTHYRNDGNRHWNRNMRRHYFLLQCAVFTHTHTHIYIYISQTRARAHTHNSSIHTISKHNHTQRKYSRDTRSCEVSTAKHSRSCEVTLNITKTRSQLWNHS